MVDRSYRSNPPSPSALAWVSETIGGAPINAIEFLADGISHSNFAVTLDSTDVVLRRWVAPGWEIEDAGYNVAREVAALALLERAGFPAPRVIATDPDGARCGVPSLLETRLPGRPPAPGAADLGQLAAAAVALHRIPPPWPGIPDFEQYTALDDARPSARTTRPELWERAIAGAAAGPPPGEPAVFIHRDYHPGNTLWSGGRLTGVIDWTSASAGPVGVDLAHMRVNLVITGADAAGFLAAYEAARGDGFRHHPYWDLRMAIDFLPDDDLAGPGLDRLERFVAGLI